MKTHFLFRLPALAVLLGTPGMGCGDGGNGNTTGPTSSSYVLILGAETEIAFGDTYRDRERDLSLTFDDVNDSRCPTGVQCVWEGDARVTLDFTSGDDSTRLDLHTNLRFDRETEALGYRLRLIAVTPYPDYANPAPPESYVATIEVTEL